MTRYVTTCHVMSCPRRFRSCPVKLDISRHACFCFTLCHMFMTVPMHFLAALGITQFVLASSCACVPIASSVFHCVRRFLCMICPHIMCVCCTECASMHITCHTYANCMFRRLCTCHDMSRHVMSCHVHVVSCHVLSSWTSRATHVSAPHYFTCLCPFQCISYGGWYYSVSSCQFL